MNYKIKFFKYINKLIQNGGEMEYSDIIVFVSIVEKYPELSYIKNSQQYNQIKQMYDEIIKFDNNDINVKAATMAPTNSSLSSIQSYSTVSSNSPASTPESIEEQYVWISTNDPNDPNNPNASFNRNESFDRNDD